MRVAIFFGFFILAGTTGTMVLKDSTYTALSWLIIVMAAMDIVDFIKGLMK